jgi:hypothetical protein
VKPIRANVDCYVPMGWEDVGENNDFLGNPGMANKLKILATQN